MYNSYAELFIAKPELLATIREHYGEQVYTDDNHICDPLSDHATVAVVDVFETDANAMIACVYNMIGGEEMLVIPIT